MRIVLVAQLEGIDSELLSEFIDRLLQSEASLRVSGRTERCSWSGVDKHVALFREHIRAVVHVLHRPSGPSASGRARSSVGAQMQRRQLAVLAGSDVQRLF